jgi:hypothetical protein
MMSMLSKVVALSVAKPKTIGGSSIIGPGTRTFFNAAVPVIPARPAPNSQRAALC